MEETESVHLGTFPGSPVKTNKVSDMGDATVWDVLHVSKQDVLQVHT
jgi:hypothetical protein